MRSGGIEAHSGEYDLYSNRKRTFVYLQGWSKTCKDLDVCIQINLNLKII